jgi:hypothetical protein
MSRIINLASMASFPGAATASAISSGGQGADAERLNLGTRELTSEACVHSPRQIEAVEDDTN